ncbi:cobalamin biosynthesis protein CobQ [Ponticoccus sp. SC2-23]|uniref:cobalamin biosynthesis protein CobQ n=1 Tax=Alexandriicola marinus TaxID=2081710 RepID=UPI000FDCBEE4|nr:cobalamin biosynthesis protein CobQ [Alexandriicola marinus]MBM1221628.1 cobalamin biosynthesis protein CobQ [Ponticoccus sp. SC6-9]MBM1226669.1 cobalamin biosynthesis protein CobQ [Ponticoccus sp. SC6-15]MBM1230620.1 cobalamin biosynthesis protein CobQ [Ponticoccus sp. SC6-38]MBM1235143.1 cobalamin biosynthesis protein CobQ [Ponticoccus sp. SC6-45]MBM1239641.1 cobalamin biosynthesis protein CobQ [Ponticoccus sp. SC6-49]MBM1243423.1 cobalamin biosynthesis protein CobQ [Ponticoccus sp. SC2-
MNTPAHLIFGMTAFGKAGQKGLTAAAFAGALIPDLSLYILAGSHLLVLGTAPDVVFGQLYYSQTWQSIFRIDNSILLWGIALMGAILARAPIAVAFCGAGLLHLGLDMPFHHDDGRAHFWPLTDWVFQSPVSYWDRDHYGLWVGGIEIAAALACCVVLWRRFVALAWRALIIVLAFVEALPGLVWAFVF